MKRNKHTNDYTIIPNAIFRDERLSIKDKGLLCLALSFPDDSDFSVEILRKISGAGRDAITTSVKKLEETGYLNRTQKRERGRMVKSVWTFTDSTKEE